LIVKGGRTCAVGGPIGALGRSKRSFPSRLTACFTKRSGAVIRQLAFARAGVRVGAMGDGGLRGDRFACGWCVRIGVDYPVYSGRVGSLRDRLRGYGYRDLWGHARPGTGRTTSNGKTLVAIDLDELQHKRLPVRSPRRVPVSDVVATLKARIEQLEAELAAEQQRA
jgi:hypothetical protein